MASSFGLFLILFGGLLMGIGYEFVSQCSSIYIVATCSTGLDSVGGFGLYVGAVFAGVGVVIVGRGKIARLLRKLSRPRPESDPNR